MYLVDTSVWIDYINGIDKEHVAFLDQLLPNPLAVGLSELIYMEILQGARSQEAFDQFVCSTIPGKSFSACKIRRKAMQRRRKSILTVGDGALQSAQALIV